MLKCQFIFRKFNSPFKGHFASFIHIHHNNCWNLESAFSSPKVCRGKHIASIMSRGKYSELINYVEDPVTGGFKIEFVPTPVAGIKRGDMALNPLHQTFHDHKAPNSEHDHHHIEQPSPEDDDNDVEKSAEELTASAFSSVFEGFLLLLGISMAAYVANFIRVGFANHRVWRTETNYCIMYSQILGAGIMGFVTQHEYFLYQRSNSRFYRVFYTSIVSGFCGSITTFSTWSMECNKSIFLQMDYTWGSAMGSVNGSRFMEWIICMTTGVAVPLVAFRFGKYIGSLSPYNNFSKDFSPKAEIPAIMLSKHNPIKETLLILIFFIVSICILCIPSILFPTWIVLTYNALFGAMGAYLRHQLSPLNNIRPNFPIGTFVSNILGTWLFAVFTAMSRFAVGYYDVASQAVLCGMCRGFCACLASASTFVAEVNQLKPKHSYIYSITTNVVAQVGIIIIFNIYAFRSVPPSALLPAPIDMCGAARDLCSTLLQRVACPTALQVNLACLNMKPDYRTYVGHCACGTFSTTRVTELVVDSQVKANTSSIVPVWPRFAGSVESPTEVLDFCLTFENMCDHYYNRVGCPMELRYIKSCNRKGLLFTEAVCECGANTLIGPRLQALIVDNALFRRYDMLPYGGYLGRSSVDLCAAYTATCTRVLQHVQATTTARVNVGCTDSLSDYSLFEGVCLAGQFNVSRRITADLFTALIKPTIATMLVKFNGNNDPNLHHVSPPTEYPSLKPITPPGRSPTPHPSDQPTRQPANAPTSSPTAPAPAPFPPVWDLCSSFVNVCLSFLDVIDCSGPLRVVRSCGGTSRTYPHGLAPFFNPT